MPTKTAPATKRDTLNVRIKPEDRNLIDRAAHLLGKSRTDFLLEAGRSAAENALLDQTLFKASPKAYAKFVARHVECWTVVNVDKIDVAMARRESPSTNRFYRVSDLVAATGDDYQDFKDRVISLTGIPVQ